MVLKRSSGWGSIRGRWTKWVWGDHLGSCERWWLGLGSWYYEKWKGLGRLERCLGERLYSTWSLCSWPGDWFRPEAINHVTWGNKIDKVHLFVLSASTDIWADPSQDHARHGHLGREWCNPWPHSLLSKNPTIRKVKKHVCQNNWLCWWWSTT